jgi:hypothetical protein
LVCFSIADVFDPIPLALPSLPLNSTLSDTLPREKQASLDTSHLYLLDMEAGRRHYGFELANLGCH